MAQKQLENPQRTWYSQKKGLTLKSLIDNINKETSLEMIDVGVILSELCAQNNSKGLLKLRKAVIDMETRAGTKDQTAKDYADCKLFLLSQLANGYLAGDINNISCWYTKYDAFDNGKVTEFYKRVTHFDPEQALPIADKVFGGELHPDSKDRLEEM
jgi:hypothetical protein